MRKLNWWLLLIAPLAAVTAVIYSRADPRGFQNLQVSLDRPAPYLVALAAAVYAAKSLYTRNPLYVLLTVLGLAFMLREFHFEWRSGENHFDWTGKGVYLAMGALGVWSVLWRKRLAEPLCDWRHTSWLMGALWAYFLSQLIARRTFRGLPIEQEIHRSLEECVETAAHLMLIVAGLVGSRGRTAPSTRPTEPRPSNAPGP